MERKPKTVNSRPLVPSNQHTGRFQNPFVNKAAEVSDAQGAPLYSEPKAIRIERPGVSPLVLTLYRDKSYLFGRAPECSIVFSSDVVSRQHGRLSFRDDGRWVYRDLNSVNGSFLLTEDPTASGDLRKAALSLHKGKERSVAAGFTILLGNSESRITFLESVSDDDLGTTPSTPESPASLRLRQSAEISARHRLPVFLLGASGSGKTYLARYIHERSQASGLFVLVNCGRLPSDSSQLTSELLGHVKGAFTGAGSARLGKLQSAHQGTLFLDEVESLSPLAQQFLLDVLDGSGNFGPLGAPESAPEPPPRFRLISASKKPLAASGLRADLTQRLAGDMIVLPTLEQRQADIPTFVETFLQEMKASHQIDAEMTPEAMKHLKAASWPGQMRELELTIQVVVGREQAKHALQGTQPKKLRIGLDAVRSYLDDRSTGFGSAALGIDEIHPTTEIRKRPSDLTASDLVAALRECEGNKTRAAAQLGIAVNTLKAKMRQLGVIG